MLRGLKMSPADIKKAIVSMDEKVLTEDALRGMKDFIPQPEEIQILKDYTGDKADLGNATLFFLEMTTIPGLASRLNGLLYKVGFTEKADIAKTVRSASHIHICSATNTLL